jgi:molybdopterin converting factor small subunit
VRVELYGVARLRTGRDAVVLRLPAGSLLGDVVARLASLYPELVGPVFGPDRRALAPGNVVSFDGERFVRDPSEPIPEGKPLLLLPAASGG